MSYLFKILLVMAPWVAQGTLPWTSHGIAQAASPKIGLILDKGGRDDRSFNAAAFAGATRAERELGVTVKTVESTDDNSYEPFLRKFAAKDYDLIIAIGVNEAEAVKKVSALFPQKHFVIVDAEVPSANVRSILFQEHEGSFLVGAIAAMQSKSGKTGFIGGMDIPLIRRFEMGYVAGAKKINSHIEVKVNYVGVTGDAWNNPPKAKELALAQARSGVDVIFAAAGASGLGMFDAAEEKNFFAIGCDSNQNWIKPGHVLTSMLKRVDIAVFESIEQAGKGLFKPGVTRYGLANHGIDFALDAFNAKLLTPSILKKVDSLKKQIIDGQITVPDYYKKKI